MVNTKEYRKLQDECYRIACDNGFHDNDPLSEEAFKGRKRMSCPNCEHRFDVDIDIVPRWLMLMVTEIAEAMEAYRHQDFENFKEELSDTIIRIMDTCEAMDIDLLDVILKKCEKNRKRGYKHGGKKC